MNATNPNAAYNLFLQRAYAHQNKTGCNQVFLFDALRDLFNNTIEPPTAAARIASFVFSQTDFLPAYECVLGYYSCILGAASAIPEESQLRRLAELVLSLSQLPDARNESQDTLRLQSQSASLVIKPGQTILIDDSRIWADLPLFEVNFCDSMYGPEAWISDGLEDDLAEQRWLSLNTFAAYLVRDSNDSELSFDFLFQYAFRTLAFALEYDPIAVDGPETLLHVTSACRWVTIAGAQLLIKSLEGTQHVPPGPIWSAEGGANVVCQARWEAWASRLIELASSDLIHEEVKTMAILSATKIRALRNSGSTSNMEPE
ncbi:hypothetical protein KCU67_g3107, partial [Aureobasidium melanogenum]